VPQPFDRQERTVDEPPLKWIPDVTINAVIKPDNLPEPSGECQARMHQTLKDYTLIEQPGPAQMEQIFHLRGYAWQSRLPNFAAPARWEDPEDRDCLHWAILHEGSVVAAARLSLVGSLEQVPNAEVYSQVLPQLKGTIGSINRLVVHPAHAKRGLSQWLDEVRLARSDAVGAAHVVAQTFAGIARVATLLNLGFCVAGEAGAYGSGPLVEMNALMTQNDRPQQRERNNVVLIRSKETHDVLSGRLAMALSDIVHQGESGRVTYALNN
jgi:hypothetical protein